MRCRVQTIDHALKTYADETKIEYVEKTPFTESDGDEFESPNKALPLPATRRKLQNRAKKQANRLHKIKTTGRNGDEEGLNDAESYDSEIERQNKKRAVNIFAADRDSSEEKESKPRI